MTLPTYKIEVAFNAGVTTPAASRSWTDVTAYVLLDSGIDITYGRGDWRSEADANTLRLTLNNSDGRFTAGRAASPYYPNVKLGRPIRVTATVGGVSSVRFVGFIDEWPLEWPAAVTSFATAQITATSRIAWLGEGLELRSIVEEEILLDGPSAYYTLGESAGATTAGDASGSGATTLAITGSGPAVVFGAATGPGTDGLTAASFAGGQYLATRLTAAPGVTNNTVTLEAFFATSDAHPAATRAIACLTNPAGTHSLRIYQQTTAGNLLGYLAINPGAFISIGVGSAVIGDGNVHHVAVRARYDAGSNQTRADLFVDGVLDGTGAGVPGNLLPTDLTVLTVGGFGGDTFDPAAVFNGSVAHVAAYAGIADTRVTSHAGAGSTGFAGETPAARITRYASYADIAATELSLDTGQVPALTHLDTTGTTALDMMRKIEATEEGVLFDRADGLLGFHDRAHRYTMTPAFVLDVNQGQVGSGMEPRLDRTTVRNDVTTSSPDGTLTARVTNATSISTYGPARESIEVATSNADEPFEHASWLVNQYNDAQPRVPSLTVDLNNLGTTLTQSVLAAAVSTQFTVKNLPSQAAVSSQDYIVEGYSESIGSTRHSITFNISQATPYAVWTVEDPVYGQYDAYPIAL